jgi:hypothetical protein
MDDREEAAWDQQPQDSSKRPNATNERTAANDETGLSAQDPSPGGWVFRFEILSADIEDGEYGYQLGLELKTLGGKHAGHTYKDWSKISGDEDDGLFIKEGTKAEELVRAVLGDEADLEDLDTAALVGGRFMARVTVSQNGKRNRVDFGSIGRIPAEDPEKKFDDMPF